MYYVYVKILLTNQGKKNLREHQGEKDAQKVYAKLYLYAITYTKAFLNSSKLFT